jgi:hypothetical protein
MTDREQILGDAGLPTRISPLLEGTSEQELTDSAHEVASDLGIRPQTEAVLLARKAIAHAAKFRAAMGEPEPSPVTPKPKKPAPAEPAPTKVESQQALVDMLHPGDGDE